MYTEGSQEKMKKKTNKTPGEATRKMRDSQEDGKDILCSARKGRTFL